MTSIHRASLRQQVAALLRTLGRRFSPGRLPAVDLTAAAIVFAPHPDDEVLGCGGIIALKAAAGADIKVVIMTDGRTSHAQFVDANELIGLRRQEALDASHAIGLQPADYHFLDFEDSRLRKSATSAHERVTAILRDFEPRQVFVPHRRDRIPDHVATFAVVAGAVQSYGKPVTMFEYPVWLWNTWPWSAARPSLRQIGTGELFRDIAHLAFGCSTRIDIRTVAHLKTEALRQFRSQMYRQQGRADWPILADVSDGSFLECFVGVEEVFRRSELNPQ